MPGITTMLYIFQRKDGKIYGCCALHIVWEDLAEVKALAVSKDFSGKGLGKELVTACIEEANVDGSNSEIPIDISDLVGLVAYMFQGGEEPAPCPY